MGTIKKRNNNYSAVVRLKGHQLYKTFTSKELAEIWIKYQEDLINDMDNFKAPPESLIIIFQCIELKLKSLEEKNVDSRTIYDFKNLPNDFKEIMDCPLNDLTVDMVKKITNEMLGSIVRKGGSKKNESSGIFSQCSPSTVLRKLRLLSAVISYMIEKGANVINPCIPIISNIKMSILKRKGKLYDEIDDI